MNPRPAAPPRRPARVRRLAALLLAAPCAAALALALPAGPAHAWFEESDVGPRGVSFGKAFTAIADDASALNWNAAGLASLPRGEVDLSVGRPYNLTDLQSAYLAVAVPRSFGTLGVSWQHMGASDVAAENTFSFGLGRRLVAGDHPVTVDVGAAFKVLRLSVSDYADPGTLENVSFGSATAVAGDLGVLVHLPSHIQLGWAVQNIGSPNFDLVEGGGSTSLPARNRVGVSYRWNPESIISMDIQERADGGTVVNLGGEVWFYNSLGIRVGANDRNAGGGVSVKSKKWQFDLSFLTNQPLGISYRAGLKVPF